MTYTFAAGKGIDDGADWTAGTVPGLVAEAIEHFIQGAAFPYMPELTFFGIHSPLTDRYTPPDTSDDANKLNVMTYNIAAPLAPNLWLQDERHRILADYGNTYFKNVDILVLTEAGVIVPEFEDNQDFVDPLDLVTEHLCCGDDKPFQQRTTILNGDPEFFSISDNGGVVVLSKGNGLVVDGHPIPDIRWLLYPHLNLPVDEELHYRYSVPECPPGLVPLRCHGFEQEVPLLFFYEMLSDMFGTEVDLHPDKGYLKVKYTKSVDGNNEDYYIIASHTTPEAEHRLFREAQLGAMGRQAGDLPGDARVLYVGDFNTENEEVGDMLSILGVRSCYGKYEGYSPSMNNFYHAAQAGLTNKRLDWILPFSNGANQPLVKARALTMRHPSVAPFDLSDHDALLAELDYNYDYGCLDCPEDIVEHEGVDVGADGHCGKAITDFEKPSSWTDGVTVSCAPAEGHFFTLGSTLVECDAIYYESGDTAECSFDVTVEDIDPPTIAATAYDVGTDPGVCYATVDNYQLSIADNCGSDLPPACVPEAGEQLPLGTTSVTCSVSDGSGNEAETLFDVTVVDTEPPMIVCPDDITVSNDFGACGAHVDYDEPVATDNCSVNTIVRTGRETGSFFPLGTTPVTYEVTDTRGQSASCSFDVTVVDTEPPVIESLAAAPDLLWPPNRKMRPVTIEAVASDNCSDHLPQCRIEAVASDKPETGKGDSNTAPDKVITGDLTVDLRAERAANGDGRVYTLDVACTDASGNSSSDSTIVTVPHDRRAALPTPAHRARSRPGR
jgi:hypothetical protein